MSDFTDAWEASLASSAKGLDLTCEEDRATFRLIMRSSMRDLKWSGMRDLAIHLGSISVPRSRTLAAKQIAELWINRINRPTERVPECAAAMGCLCASYSRGNPAGDPCDTSEGPKVTRVTIVLEVTGDGDVARSAVEALLEVGTIQDAVKEFYGDGANPAPFDIVSAFQE